MTEQRRIQGDSRLGFASYDDLEGEQCIECGEQATVAVEDYDGLTHYCDKHVPKT